LLAAGAPGVPVTVPASQLPQPMKSALPGEPMPPAWLLRLVRAPVLARSGWAPPRARALVSSTP
jgi:hypothetical protein